MPSKDSYAADEDGRRPCSGAPTAGMRTRFEPQALEPKWRRAMMMMMMMTMTIASFRRCLAQAQTIALFRHCLAQARRGMTMIDVFFKLAFA